MVSGNEFLPEFLERFNEGVVEPSSLRTCTAF
jgi:hypothetical protein